MTTSPSQAAALGVVRWPKRKSLPREEVRQAFRKEPNDSWEEECCRSRRRPWEEDGRLHIEGMREEMHRFDGNNHTYFLLMLEFLDSTI